MPARLSDENFPGAAPGVDAALAPLPPALRAPGN
jgi:hypothetical protein